jgi:hypothetical protein
MVRILAFSKIIGYGTIQYRQKYEDFSQTNEKALSDSITQAFPSDFSNYLALYDQYNNRDLCQAFYSSNVTGKIHHVNLIISLSECCFWFIG